MDIQRLKTLSASLKRKRDFAFIPALVKKYPNAEVFLVGGIIRDTILKRESKDYDFVVRNVSLRNLLHTLQKLGTVNLVGRTFGVLKFMPKGSKLTEPIDIALPRKDHAFGTGGYKDVKTQSSATLPIEEDLKRRDFTVNAIAWNMSTGTLVDPANGMTDLKRKVLKTVGDPSLRFREDFTRMLRGIRFACQLDFALEKRTSTAITKLVKNLNVKRDGKFLVPREMVGHELVKAFVANAVRALDLTDKLGVIKTLMPELLTMKGCEQPTNFHTEGDVWQHTRMALEVLSTTKYKKQFRLQKESGETAEVIFGTLFHDLGKPYTIQTPEKDGTDRIRFNNHDVVGAEKAHEIMTRLSFSVFPKTDTRYHIDPDRVAWIIRYHLVGFRNDIEVMRATTVEEYFVSQRHPSESLLRVQYADTAATINAGDKIDFSGFRKILKRVAEIQRKSKNKRAAPPPLVNGNDVMKILKITPGPNVGIVLTKLREQQLRGRVTTPVQARRWLRTTKSL